MNTPACLIGGFIGGTRKVYHSAYGTRFHTSTSNCVCTSKRWTQHSETKVKGKRCKTGQGMKTLPSMCAHTYLCAAKMLLGLFPWTCAPVLPQASVGFCEKDHYSDLLCSILYQNKYKAEYSQTLPPTIVDDYTF